MQVHYFSEAFVYLSFSAIQPNRYCLQMSVLIRLFHFFSNVLSPSLHSFIHSDNFYSASSSPLLLRGAPDYRTNTVSEFHAEAHRQTTNKGLAQGPYVAARAGVEPTTVRLRVIDLTNAPPRLHPCKAVIEIVNNHRPNSGSGSFDTQHCHSL